MTPENTTYMCSKHAGKEFQYQRIIAFTFPGTYLVKYVFEDFMSVARVNSVVITGSFKRVKINESI